MAEAAFKRMIPSLIRQTRPQISCRGKPLRYFQRDFSTATAAQPREIEDRELPWQPHSVPTAPVKNRLERLRAESEPRTFSSFLTDNYARQHNYLRISVTERCNLRCLYCMPEEGIELSPSDRLLTTPEIVHLSSVFVDQGVTKIRLTGGEPTVRKDIVSLMQQIGQLRRNGLKELCITTNGISLHRKLDSMVESGLTAVNLSLDTLDPHQFTLMTRRNGHEAVMKSINQILGMNKMGAGIKLKINCVVMRGLNEREIIPFVEMGKDQNIEARFIEYMPFDGNKWSEKKMMTFQEMLVVIRQKYPDVQKVQDHPNDTSKTYQVPGFAGRIGFITSMTENFCGSCNRLRITSDGSLKVCLFGNSEVSLRDIMREANDGKPIDQETMEAIKQVEMDRQQGAVGSTGGLGVSPREARLLQVIGMAVKRKEEKHAGIGDLENMKNRPMILIEDGYMPTLHSATRPSSLFSGRHRPWLTSIPLQLLPAPSPSAIRWYSTPVCRRQSSDDHASTSRLPKPSMLPPSSPKLTHLTSTGAAHMVSISHKLPTSRSATAIQSLIFSSPSTYATLSDATLGKGDAIAVARIAGIQAAKRTSELIPLAHPGLQITGVHVDVEPFTAYDANTLVPQQILKNAPHGGVLVTATVSCEGKTGVEMEALTAANVAGLAMYDMLKGVDKGMSLREGRVLAKSGGKSGNWRWDWEKGKITTAKEDETAIDSGVSDAVSKR